MTAFNPIKYRLPACVKSINQGFKNVVRIRMQCDQESRALRLSSADKRSRLIRIRMRMRHDETVVFRIKRIKRIKRCRPVRMQHDQKKTNRTDQVHTQTQVKNKLPTKNPMYPKK